MYKLLLPLGMALAAYSATATAQLAPLSPVRDDAPAKSAAGSTVLTLAQALDLAERASVDIRQTEAGRDALLGDLQDAGRPLWNNPRVTGETIRREVPASGLPAVRQREWSASFEQTFETAGQQSYRRRAAQAQLAGHGAMLEETRRAVRAAVETSFVEVLALQERIATENVALGLIQDAARSVGKRVAAGEDSRLDGNLAQVEAVRARNQIGVLEEQLIEARARLAEQLQLPAGALPTASGTLAISRARQYTPAGLLTGAAQRPLLRALESKEEAARHRLSLERASRYPDLTVGLSTSREGPAGSRERLTGVTLSIPLPLFHRNAGAIGRAASDVARAGIERAAAIRNSQAGVSALWQRVQSLSERVKSLRTAILPMLEQNQDLSRKSLQAGEISIVQLLLVNRQLLDGRKDLIDAEKDLRVTDIALRSAAGETSRP
jgi:cobalt-zinc-cadmium efflux system outer membrane protein